MTPSQQQAQEQRNQYVAEMVKNLDVINNFVFAAALITAFFIVLWLVEAI